MPKPKQKKPRTLLCDCGKRFRSPQDQLQHTLNSSLHQQPILDQPPLSISYTAATPDLSGEAEEAQELAAFPGKEIDSAGKFYTTKAIAGKGKGLVATTKIPKGTRILSEVPIFRVPRNNPDIKALECIVAKEVECLNEDQQRAFFDLTLRGQVLSSLLGSGPFDWRCLCLL